MTPEIQGWADPQNRLAKKKYELVSSLSRWWFQILYFYFHPYLGKIPILTNIFQLGWLKPPTSYIVTVGGFEDFLYSPTIPGRWFDPIWWAYFFGVELIQPPPIDDYTELESPKYDNQHLFIICQQKTKLNTHAAWKFAWTLELRLEPQYLDIIDSTISSSMTYVTYQSMSIHGAPHVFLPKLQFHNSGFDAIDDAVTAIVGTSWDPKDVWNFGLSDPEWGDLLWFDVDPMFFFRWICDAARCPRWLETKWWWQSCFFWCRFFSTNSSSGWLLQHLMKPPQTCPTTVLCRVSTSSALRFAGTRGNMPEAWSFRQKRREQL